MLKTASEKHFDKVAKNYDYYKNKNSFYYENLKKLLAELIPKNKIVLEFGCGTGDLLASLRPKNGYGMDISGQMILIAKDKYQNLKNLHFSTKLPSDIYHQPLEYIFMSDVIEHLDNPNETFLKIRELMNKETIFICTMANPFWEPVLMIAEKLGLKMPEGPHHRLKISDLRFMINEAGMKIIKHDYKLLMPIKIPLLTNFANKYLEKYLKKFAFIEYFTAVKA